MEERKTTDSPKPTALIPGYPEDAPGGCHMAPLAGGTPAWLRQTEGSNVLPRCQSGQVLGLLLLVAGQDDPLNQTHTRLLSAVEKKGHVPHACRTQPFLEENNSCKRKYPEPRASSPKVGKGRLLMSRRVAGCRGATQKCTLWQGLRLEHQHGFGSDSGTRITAVQAGWPRAREVPPLSLHPLNSTLGVMLPNGGVFG